MYFKENFNINNSNDYKQILYLKNVCKDNET